MLYNYKFFGHDVFVLIVEVDCYKQPRKSIQKLISTTRVRNAKRVNQTVLIDQVIDPLLEKMRELCDGRINAKKTKARINAEITL